MLMLAVDDDPDDLALLGDTLTRIDPAIIFITAPNGKAALDYLKNDIISIPDIIFLDINMPVLNGKDTLFALRSLKEFRQTRIIIFSTSVSPADRELFERNNADVEIKPSSITRWFDVIHEKVRLVS